MNGNGKRERKELVIFAGLDYQKIQMMAISDYESVTYNVSDTHTGMIVQWALKISSKMNQKSKKCVLFFE